MLALSRSITVQNSRSSLDARLKWRCLATPNNGNQVIPPPPKKRMFLFSHFIHRLVGFGRIHLINTNDSFILALNTCFRKIKRCAKTNIHKRVAQQPVCVTDVDLEIGNILKRPGYLLFCYFLTRPLKYVHVPVRM